MFWQAYKYSLVRGIVAICAMKMSLYPGTVKLPNRNILIWTARQIIIIIIIIIII